MANLEAGQARLEAGQARLEGRATALEASQVHIEAKLDDVVSTVKRHDAEIIKLWAVHRPPPRRARSSRS